ncbi:MAG TPA: hypothetical protein VFP84_10585 [Kofleriaceae bacterium]|nr:hypothetical protein [Kofleriaceae bacterium]
MTTIVCPSGLTGTIRGLKGKEGKLLSDRNAARGGAMFDELLTNCWLSTVDPGVYHVPDTGALDWSKVLVADRFYALLQIRAITFGNEYAFAVQCASHGCRHRFEWQLDLTQLPVTPLSEDARATFRAGNRFETRLPRDGRRVWFRLLTGADEARAANVLKTGRDGMLMTALAMRIIEIEDVGDSDKRRFLDDIEMADATALLDQFDEADGGVETGLEVECPACLAVQDVQLPFERGFFLPTSKAKAGR